MCISKRKWNEYMKSTDTAFGQLLDDGGAWSTLPWNVDLGAEQDE